MLLRKSLYFICFLGITLSTNNKLFPDFAPETKQQILPTGFGYFENLYFNATKGLFFTVGNNVNVEKAVYTPERRGYHWRSYLSLPSLKKYPISIVPGASVIVLERCATPGHFSHLFHSLEHFLGLWNFAGEQLREEVRLFIIANNGMEIPEKWIGQKNDTTYHLIKALFPNAEIKLWFDFVNETKGHLLRFEKVITSDRSMEIFKKEPYPTDRMLGGYFQSLTKESLDRLASVVHAYAKVEKIKSEKVVVTYVERPSSPRITADIERDLINRIKQLPEVELRVVDFAALSFNEQVNVAANTDVLLSTHGNGLSHTLFLPSGATLIELFPKDLHRVEYRIIAKARGLNYFGMMEDRGWMDDTMAWFGDGSKLNNPIRNLDIEAIISVLQKIKKISS